MAKSSSNMWRSGSGAFNLTATHSGDGTVPTSTTYDITVTDDEWNVDDVSNPGLGITVVDKARARIQGVGENMGILIKNTSTYDKPVTLQGAVIQYSDRGLKR